MNIQAQAKTVQNATTDVTRSLQLLEGRMAELGAKTQQARTETHGIEELLMKLALSGADAKTLILARQILECDQMISDNLNEIQSLNKLRQAHVERKQEIVAFKAFVNKYSDGGTIDKADLSEHWPNFIAENEGLAKKYGLLPMPATWNTQGRPERPPCERPVFDGTEPEAEELWNAYDSKVAAWRPTGAMDPNYSSDLTTQAYMKKLGEAFLSNQSFERKEDGAIETHYDGALFTGDSISVEEIDSAQLRQDNAMQKLDQAKELINIRNQQALQRKQRTLTLISNFSRAEHEGRQAVISNTRA